MHVLRETGSSVRGGDKATTLGFLGNYFEGCYGQAVRVPSLADFAFECPQGSCWLKGCDLFARSQMWLGRLVNFVIQELANVSQFQIKSAASKG